MILGNNKLNEVISTEETKKMQIDTGSMHILQMLLSQNLYSAPIPSLVRELTCNGVDAVIEAGKDPKENPVLVSIYEENDNYFFSVKDTGLGLDEEGFDGIISMWLKSTKRDSSELIGAMGIGSKSPLAYTDSYYWVCRKDGIERKYSVFKGEQFTEYVKLYEKDTDEVNGTEVIVPIKSERFNHKGDHYKFVRAVQEQLAYFDTVVISICGQIKNDYKIYREEEFQYSTLADDYNIHITLKDVYYPIDWFKLGMSSVNLGVAIRFDLDSGIIPNPSRESIIYNQHTIDLIKEKINNICLWFVNKYNETITEVDSFMDIVNHFNTFASKRVTLGEKGFSLSVLDNYYKSLLKTPTIKEIKKINLQNLYDNADYILYDYKILASIQNGSYRSPKNETYNIFNRVCENKNNEVIICEEKPKPLILDYIKEFYGEDTIFIKKRTNKISLKGQKLIGGGKTNNWIDILKLRSYPKNEWRQILEEFGKIKKGIEDHFVRIEDIVPTKEWIEERKKNKTKNTITKVSQEEINPKIADFTGGSSKYTCVFEAGHKKKISEFDTNITYIYSKIDDRDKLDDLFQMFKRRRDEYVICVLVDRDIKRIKDAGLNNWLSIEQFMEGKLEIFGKYCTAYKIQELIDSNEQVFNNLSFVEKIDEDVATRLRSIRDWMNDVVGTNSTNGDLMKEMAIIAEKEDLWEKEQYEEYSDLIGVVNSLSFLKFLKRGGYYSGGAIEEGCLEFAKEYYNNLKPKKEEVYEQQN